jgi:hypothetical protein
MDHSQRTLVEHTGDWSLYVSREATTTHPLQYELRDDGGQCYPAIDLVLFPERASHIPEVQALPVLETLLTAANARLSLLRTTACDAACRTADDTSRNGGFPFVAGAWVHLAYRLDCHNQRQEKLLTLARFIQAEFQAPYLPYGVRSTVSPYKEWFGRHGYYGLALEFVGKGHDADDALVAATETGHSLAKAIAQVSTSDTLLYMS